MTHDQNDRDQPEPERAPKEEVPTEFLKAVESYAEAVKAENTEAADEAALKVFLMAAEQAMVHPTPELELAEQADGRLRTADWAGAEEAYRKLLAIRDESGNPGLMAKPRMDLSQLFRLLGRMDEARELAQAATECARKSEIYPLIAMALRNEVSCALVQGRKDEALAAASEALRVIAPDKLGDLMRAMAYTDRAECLLAVGEVDAAEQDLRASLDLLRARGSSRIGAGPIVAVAKWCEVQAQLDLSKGNLADALAHLQQGAKHRREGFNRSCDPSPYALAALAGNFETTAEVRNRMGDTPGREQALAEAKAIWAKVRSPAQPH